MQLWKKYKRGKHIDTNDKAVLVDLKGESGNWECFLKYQNNFTEYNIE